MATSILALVNNVKNWISAITISAGIADASKVPLTNSSGILDNSFVNWASPAAIGSATPNSVKATTIDASGTTHTFGVTANAFTAVVVDGSAAGNKQVLWRSAGNPRWNLFVNGASTETGGNAGSPITLSYYNDANGYAADVWTANRLGQFAIYPATTFSSTIGVTGAATFSSSITCKGISSTGTQVLVSPSSSPSGGIVRTSYTTGAHVAVATVGPSSNCQIDHGPSGTAITGISNTGGSLALQWLASTSSAQGNVLIGTGTNNGTDKLQVAGSASFTGAITASGYAKISGSGGSNSSALDIQSSAYNSPHVAFLDASNPTGNAPLKLVQSGLRTYNFLFSSGGLGALAFSNSSSGGFTANFQSNLNSTSLPLTLSNVNAAIGYGAQFNFQLGDGTNLYNCGGLAYRQETAFTSTASTQNVIVTLSSMTAGSATEKFRIVSAGRFLLGTTTDDGSNLLQVAGGIAATGTLKIGSSGATITRKLRASSSVNTTIGVSATTSITIACTGAQVNDAVSVGPPSNLPAAIIPTAFVSAANAVTLNLYNANSIGTLVNGTFTVSVEG